LIDQLGYCPRSAQCKRCVVGEQHEKEHPTKQLFLISLHKAKFSGQKQSKARCESGCEVLIVLVQRGSLEIALHVLGHCFSISCFDCLFDGSCEVDTSLKKLDRLVFRRLDKGAAEFYAPRPKNGYWRSLELTSCQTFSLPDFCQTFEGHLPLRAV
jgi:hypothetical protein